MKGKCQWCDRLALLETDETKPHVGYACDQCLCDEFVYEFAFLVSAC